MTTHDFDLFVIGGGSGGVRAARVAASYGAKVAIAEADRFGGTCVIRGCVPKKLLVYASRFRGDFEDAAGFGWTVGETSFDWGKLIAAKDREVARLEGLYRSNLDAKGVTTISSHARLAGPSTVELSDGRTLSARVVLIATGGVPSTDETLPGREHVITSNEIFEMKTLPRRMIVAGGGYIAVEFASLLNGLGVETTLIYRGDRILRGFDSELRSGLMEALERRGVRLVMGHVFSNIEKTERGLVGSLKGGGSLEADAIMFAIGRKPATAGLGLETVGIKTGAKGEIVVDAFSETSVPGIYAVGDVTDRVSLTPVAIREGHAFADTVFGKTPVKVDHKLIPTAVFSTPEIGTVGLSEEAARETFSDVHIYKSRFRPMRHTLAGRDERTLMKLVVDGETDRMLGVHVLGPDAAEIIQMAAIPLHMGATKAQFDATFALHPSAAEELVTMRERAK